MLQSYWMALGAFSFVMTLGWLYRPKERVTFAAMFSAGGYALMAITAADLQTISETGDRVPAGLGQAPQLFLVALSLLALLAAVLSRFDAYPPEDMEDTL